MTELWKTLIPSQYISITKCHYIAPRLIKDICAEVVICTVYGQVLEFSGHHIVGVCDKLCLDAKSITPFTTYDNQCNVFYVVECDEELIILSRTKELKVIKQLKNVEKFLVTDFSNTGFPQLGIWTKDAKESVTPNIIVKFNESDEVQSEDCSISNILSEKYQELNMKVEEYENRLKLKKQNRLYSCEVSRYSKEVSHPLASQLMLLVGQGGNQGNNGKNDFQQTATLVVEETWQRLHNGKWVVGVSVSNNGKRNIKDLHLILRCLDEGNLTYHTKLLMYRSECQSSSSCKRMRFDDEAGSEFVDWQEVTVLKPHRRAVLVAVLTAPSFIGQCVVTLSGIITYMMEEKSITGNQVPVPSFQLQVETFSKRIGSPFTSESTEADVLCVLISSYIVTLPVILMPNFEPSLQKIILNELGFTEFSNMGCLYHKGSSYPELSGIMLYMETLAPQEYCLTICARDVQQVYILVQCMYSMLSAPHIIIHPPKTHREFHLLSTTSRYLLQELELVLNSLKQRAIEDTFPRKARSSVLPCDVKMSQKEYSQFRAQLSKLELETDTLQ